MAFSKKNRSKSNRSKHNRSKRISAALFALALIPGVVSAADADSTDVSLGVTDEEVAVGWATGWDSVAADQGSEVRSAADGGSGGGDVVIYLVPEMKDAGYRVSDDRSKYKNRISFSPGIGQLGNQDFFAFRLGFSPNTWLGYEISLGHNPASSLHAMLHTFNVVLRYPVPWRIQPYVTVGYGMMTVFPGEALNADRVSKNTLTAGGGIEFYIRDDVALRGEMRGATVLGQQFGSDGTVAYGYREYTIGFSFFRSLGG